VLLGGVFCAHLFAIMLFYMDSPDPIKLAERNQITNHAASAVRVLEVAPKGAIPDLLEAMSSPFEKFWIDQNSGGERTGMSAEEARLARELERKLGGIDRFAAIKFGEQGQDPATNLLGFSVAARLRDGAWLHYQRGRIEPLKWWRDLPFSIGVST